MSRLSDLRSLILEAKHAYYNSGEPLMGDDEYDALEDELRLLSPDDPVLSMVGAEAPADAMLTKARHSMPMGSQSKVNSEFEFRTWCTRSRIDAIHASLKGDGASAAAYYRDGQLVQAISRGDGTVGEDITANARRFKGIPAWVAAGTEGGGAGFSGAVRFEVILTVEDWTRLDPARSKNPRNAGNGIMGRKNGHQSDSLTIFAFDLDEMRNGASVVFRTESEKTARLAELGFNVIAHLLCDTAEDAVRYFREVHAARDALPIWIDGVVMKADDIARQAELGVTAGRPKGQVAWKFDSSGAETVLEDVVISGGHTGGLYPTAQLRPVDIGGTTVSNASLANFDEIERLDVAIGDSVWVVKANDIIPKIVRVTDRPVTRRPILAPVACPFCGGAVGRRRTTGGSDGVIIECRNAECPKKSTGKIRRWIASVDILGIGDGVLEALLDRFALEDAAGLYTLRGRADELADLVINAERDIRLGQKRALSILDAIDATRTLTLSQFLGSLGLDHLGKRRVELMIRAAGGALNTLGDWQSGRLRDAAFAVQAGVPNIGGPIQDGIDSMAQVIDRLLAAGVTVLPPQVDLQATSDGEVDQPLKTICISGKLPSGCKKADYVDPLRAAGYELVDEVIKGLDFLVLAEPGSTSGKAEKARRLGVAVITEESLRRLIDEPVVEGPAPTVPPQSGAVPVIQELPTGGEVPMPAAKKATSVSERTRRFEYVDDKSSKFWEIRVIPEGVEVRYGKIGANGQTQLKPFDDAAAALKSAEKLVAEKLRGGYVEQGSLDAASAPTAVARAAVETSAAKTAPSVAKSAKVVKAAAPVVDSPALPLKASAPAGGAVQALSKSLCISGKLPSGRKKSDYEDALRSVGIALVDDVFKGLTYFVLADPASTSSKAQKARALGVEVISEADLNALCGSGGTAQVASNRLQLPLIKSSEVAERVEEATALLKKLLDYLATALPPLSPKRTRKGGTQKPTHSIVKSLELSAEAWRPIVEKVAIDDLDRTASMFAGPFFTSTDYPIPTIGGHMLMPVVQLDLRQFSGVNGSNLGDGLFQLWCAYDFSTTPRDLIRVIPRDSVRIELLEKFEFIWPKQDVTPIYSEVEYGEGATHADVIVGLEAIGMQSGPDFIYEDDYGVDVFNTIIEDLERFREVTEVADREVHFFGGFNQIQYSSTDIGIPCFISFPEWGSQGNAQVFYSGGSGDDLWFLFEESLR